MANKYAYVYAYLSTYFYLFYVYVDIYTYICNELKFFLRLIINCRLRIHSAKNFFSKKAGLWDKFYKLPSCIHKVSKWEKEILPLVATFRQIYKGLLGVSRAGFAGRCCY